MSNDGALTTGETQVKVRKLLGTALVMPMLLGGLVLLTASPAAACTCYSMSEAERVASADAVFVGTLVSRSTRIDQRAQELMASSDPEVAYRAFLSDSTHSVWTFQVSRVYKGAVGQRQEIITAPGAPGGSNCSGVGALGVGALGQPSTEPFVVFAFNSGGHRYRPQPGQYASSACSGSRPLVDGGEPVHGGLRVHAPGGPRRSSSPAKASRGSPASTSGGLVATGTSSSHVPSPAPAGLVGAAVVLVVGVSAGLGLVALRARRRASPD
jgi:hypothetical protein